MNSDIIDGSIADSTTLNLFAYVNGNPISYVDPFGLCADKGKNNSDNYSINGYSANSENINISYFFCGETIRNPWWELNYPGEIHNFVVEYLSTMYGLQKEVVPTNNKHHRYDLYSNGTNSYWEVKPMSYKTTPFKIILLDFQMNEYDKDGVGRGIPLGKHTTQYQKYTINIYSEEPGKVFYTFEYKKDPQKYPVQVEQPENQESTQNSTEVDWGDVGNTVASGLLIVRGTIVTIIGVYSLITMGDTSSIEQGIKITEGVH